MRIGLHSVVLTVLLISGVFASGCATTDPRVARSGGETGWRTAFAPPVKAIAVSELRLPVKATIARRESALRHKG